VTYLRCLHIIAAVVIIVSLGRLPGDLARKWGHPQASAVAAAGWIGIATGGLMWPIAFIWAFIVPAAPENARTRKACAISESA